MFHATRQLEQVRQIGRLLLLIQQVTQAVAIGILVCLGCSVVDYALRLPGLLRLGIGVTIMAAAAVWLIVRVTSVVRFRPTLSTMALRAERLFPQLTGVLASSIEFYAGDRHLIDDSSSTAALTRLSIVSAEQRLTGLSLWRLINPRTTIRSLLVTLALMVALGGVLLASPSASRLAALRWLDPLGLAHWPNRTQIRSLMTDRVWPSDTPLRFRARVERGYYSGMRTWVVYRLLDANGNRSPFQALLMSQQAQTLESPDSGHVAQQSSNENRSSEKGVFERLVDLTQQYIDWDPNTLPTIEFYFQAGDDQTELQELPLIARPSVQTVTTIVEPPAYAQGLVKAQEMTLGRQGGIVASVHAVAGSKIDLRVQFNKLLQNPTTGWDGLLPGLIGYGEMFTEPPGERFASQIRKTFVVNQSVQTPIRVTDRHGLSNLSDRMYRFVVVSDNPPTVWLTQPTVDESVLPTAVIEIEAIAQDDVGIRTVALTAKQEAIEGEADPPTERPLSRVSGRMPRLSVRHRFDLQPLGLQPGQTILLTAVTNDVYELDGLHHEAVRSTPRRLRIIDAATLMGQIRTELAAIRQQAIRTETRQRSVIDLPVTRAWPSQKQLTVHLNTQSAQIASVQQRIRRNRLTLDQAGHLHRLVIRAAQLSDQAEQSSRSATVSLAFAQSNPQQALDHRQKAQDQQQQVSKILVELIDLLDQGRDALALHLRLQQLKTLQQTLAEETRRFMPVTLGWSLDQLSKPEQQKLKEIADQQAQLAKLAETLLRRMQATADVLSRQSDQPDDQAAAQVLAEAASIARRQGLVTTLQQASNKAQKNRLSDAGNSQQLALDVVDEMLEQLAHVDQRRQAILRRRLIQLAQAIKKLIKRQTAQLDRLDQLIDLSALDPPLSALRRNTLALAQRAHETAQSDQAGIHLDKAATEQATAISALRKSLRPTAQMAGNRALDRLKQALESIQKLQFAANAKRLAKQRRKLQQAYEKLAQQQEQLRDQTVPLTQLKTLSRRQRVHSLSLGHREADLNIAAGKLLPQVQKTFVFTYLHEQIDQDTEFATSRLRRAQPDQDVLAKQETIASMLRQMSQALGRESETPEFSGVRGGGGGGGGDVSMVPPLAELKLLRGLQQQVYRHTRQIDRQKEVYHSQVVEDLSAKQRDLGVLGEKLIRMMQQASQDQTKPTR